MTANRLPIVVYSKPGCVQCDATARWLKSKGIQHRKVDVTQDPEAYERVLGLGYQQVPVIVVPFDWPNGGSHWSGFNPGELAKLL